MNENLTFLIELVIVCYYESTTQLYIEIVMIEPFVGHLDLHIEAS